MERSENVLLTGDNIEMASEEKVADTIAEQAIDEQSNKNELPATYEPPLNSPLTGCYLLIILGEPHSQQHKDIILQRLLKGNLIRCFQCCFFQPFPFFPIANDIIIIIIIIVRHLHANNTKKKRNFKI